MASWLEVIGALLIGAIDDADAAARLGVSTDEVRRLSGVVAPQGGAGLVPIAVDLAARRIELVDLRGVTYREPFFHETVDRVRREQPGGLDVDVDFESFARAAQRYRAPPDGFIYHVGRCGSTLLANMLAATGDNLLLKEPDLVSDLLADWLAAEDDAARAEAETVIDAALRYLVGTAGAGRARVVKLAAWNVRLAGLLARLFPTTPGVFIYRSAEETVASLMFQPPSWFDLLECPRALQARFFPTVGRVPAEGRLSPAQLFAHAWRSAVESALALPPERMLFVGYRDMVDQPADVMGRVLSHLRQPSDPATVAAMIAARGAYSKDPTGRAGFDPAGAHRRPPLAAADEAEVQAIVGEVLRPLEERCRVSGSRSL